MKIRLENISKSFLLNKEQIKIIDNISLSVRQGSCVALLGPSGCGKSTLLAMIAGFFPPDSGTIATEGKVSLCLQNDMLLPWRDILSNVCLPVEINDKAALQAAKQQAEQYLPLFGLAGFGHSFPAQLSGGMSQRAALLRTLMAGGDFWLLDEPFAKLDALTKEELQLWLFEIIRQFHPGILLITHDIDEALRLADKIYLLSPRPAKIIAELSVPKLANSDEQEQISYQLKKTIRDILRTDSSTD